MFDIKDYRYVTNNKLFYELKARAIKEIRKINDPSIQNFSFDFGVIVDFEKIGYIKTYAPIQRVKSKHYSYGNVVTEVQFPQAKTIEDVFNAFTSDNDPKYKLKKTISFLFQSEDEFKQNLLYIASETIILCTDQIKDVKPTDRIFNFTFPRIGKTYFGYMSENNYNNADIYDYTELPDIKFIKHINLEDLLKYESTESTPKNKTKWIHNFFNTSKRNGKTYEKIN